MNTHYRQHGMAYTKCGIRCFPLSRNPAALIFKTKDGKRIYTTSAEKAVRCEKCLKKIEDDARLLKLIMKPQRESQRRTRADLGARPSRRAVVR